MEIDFNKIRQVKQNHEKNWLKIKDVVGVGIGTTSNGKYGIVVSVKKNPKNVRSAIPETIENIPIDVQETGEIKAL
jgi:hypothetical protein